MHPMGTSFRAPVVKFFVRIDLDPNTSYLDGNYLTEKTRKENECTLKSSLAFISLTSDALRNILTTEFINDKDAQEDTMAQQTRVRLIVSGRVQGVCFRMETQKAAVRFGVYGWGRNKRDGSVEIIAEGDETDVTSLINWCRTGPPLSSVQKVEVSRQAYQGDFDTFNIRY